LKKEAILCVDDEAIILMSIKQELRAHFRDRFIYETATSMEDALAVMDAFASEGISLVALLTDWIMPKLSGEELINAFHRRDPLLPCVVVTGQSNDEKINALKNEGKIRAILQKPWSTEALIKVIELCVADAHSASQLSK